MAKTAQEVINAARADKCLTPSRSRSHRPHRNYSNKYTQELGRRDYKGINDDGYFTKFYPYGVVGHCAIFTQYWLIESGYPEFVPHRGYIWNTNQYAKWLKSEPYIKGRGRVQWVENPKYAKPGAICFKGAKGSKSYTHTCIFIKYEDGYVYTVDGNVSGRYKGKKINNGVVKKRKASKFRWGFANMPYVKAPAPYIAGRVYQLQNTMNVRANHSSTSKKIGTMKRGTKIAPLRVYKTSGGAYWLQTAYKGEPRWICARSGKKIYIK